MKCPNCGHEFQSPGTALVAPQIAEAVREEATARKAREAVLRHAAEIVFTYHRDLFGHSPTRCRLTPSKERFILARLRENDGEVSELLYAADGARRDPNLNGNNERGVTYLGIENVYRNRERVERLVGLSGWDGRGYHPFLG